MSSAIERERAGRSQIPEETECEDFSEWVGGPVGLEQLRKDVAAIVQTYQVGRPTFELADAIGLELSTLHSSVMAWGECEALIMEHLLTSHLPDSEIEDITEREAKCIVAGMVMGYSVVLRELCQALATGINVEELAASFTRPT